MNHDTKHQGHLWIEKKKSGVKLDKRLYIKGIYAPYPEKKGVHFSIVEFYLFHIVGRP